ncbi:MAG TPA: GAF and ANTAR domain-containing protein [Naasia sp.]
MTRNSFSSTAAALVAAEGSTADLTGPLLGFLAVDGASISTLGDFLGTETVAASDGVIARIDEIQFDLGEGPCWDAMASARPILEPDLRRAPRHHWPAFSPAAEKEDVAAIFAFPLLIGPLRIGAIDLYAREPGELGEETTSQTSRLASIISRNVLRRALLDGAAEPADRDAAPFSRRAVHQATGFVIAQCGVSAEDAHLLLQGHAYAEGRSMREVADDVLSGRLSFTADGWSIEEAR